jgi:hypothetical protein
MFLPGIDTYDNKTELLTLFGYTVVSDMVETLCGDIVGYDEMWSWLVKNGVSMDYSYQSNMTTYLARFGFTRTSYAHKRNAVFDILEREVTQKRALLAADLIRSKGLNVPCVLILNGTRVYVANTYFSIEQSLKTRIAK